jgi:hypothetical protein
VGSFFGRGRRRKPREPSGTNDFAVVEYVPTEDHPRTQETTTVNTPTHQRRVPHDRFADRKPEARPDGDLLKINVNDSAESPASREDWTDHWIQHRWRTSGRKTKYENIEGYNVLYMPDHNNSEVWTLPFK